MPRIRRLSWAGAWIATGERVVLLDPLFDASQLARLGMGEARSPIVAPAEAGSVDVIAVTHIHPDHCDPSGWRAALRPGGVVLGPKAVVAKAAEARLEGHAMAPWESLTIDDLVIAAIPAVDGLGEEQVSWLVRGADWSLFHGGDTLWHGHWWRTVREHGNPGTAMLPVNGAIAAFPGMQASPLPATLTPEQAVVAALLLGAERLVPIHYGEFHAPPVYVETPDLEARLAAAAAEHGVAVDLVAPGGWIE